MNFTNVRLILAREVRDQLRDRRTLFMIFVLPILLYPLLGTAYFQMVQFQTRNAMTVLVVGGGQLASAPTPLIEGAGFSPQLFSDGPRGAELLKLEMAPEEPPSGRRHGRRPGGRGGPTGASQEIRRGPGLSARFRQAAGGLSQGHP